MKKTSKYLIYTAAFTSFCFAFQETVLKPNSPTSLYPHPCANNSTC